MAKGGEGGQVDELLPAAIENLRTWGQRRKYISVRRCAGRGGAGAPGGQSEATGARSGRRVRAQARHPEHFYYAHGKGARGAAGAQVRGSEGGGEVACGVGGGGADGEGAVRGAARGSSRPIRWGLLVDNSYFMDCNLTCFAWKKMIKEDVACQLQHTGTGWQGACVSGWGWQEGG